MRVSIRSDCDHGNVYCAGACARQERCTSVRCVGRGTRCQRTGREARRHAAAIGHALPYPTIDGCPKHVPSTRVKQWNRPRGGSTLNRSAPTESHAQCGMGGSTVETM